MERSYLERLNEFQAANNIFFKNTDLLVAALTHPSYIAEHPDEGVHNQRLEFLGDAVLGAVVADYLYHRYPEHSEGQLTKMRAAIVCETTLARLANSLRLGELLRLGRGEEATGGRHRISNLADSFEALVAAVFLDKGWDAVRRFLHGLLDRDIENILSSGCADYKTCLQEMVQQHGCERVDYVLLEESGPDHDKRFVSGVYWRSRLLGKGTGKTKKEAEQEAARAALEALKKDMTSP